jgi:hypothetical protein
MRSTLSSVSDSSCHRDPLGDSIFADGQSFTITQMSLGRADLLIVDGGGGTCAVRNFPVYGNRSFNLTLGWLIDNCE